MRVDGVGSNLASGGVAAQAMDTVSKNLRAQIAAAQKQMQELAANKEMEPEEKMERRKEIQQRITDLNAQLRQHEIELRQEKQQKMQQEGQSEQARRQEAKQKAKHSPVKLDTSLSQGSMEAMISADRAVGQAKVQGNVASVIKGRANVLKSEIEHAGRGAAVERKQESVAEIEARLEDLAKEQAQSLHRAGKEMEEAAKDTREERKAENEKQREEEGIGQGTGKSGKAGVGQGTGKSSEAGGRMEVSTKAPDGTKAEENRVAGGEKKEQEQRAEEREERGQDAQKGNLQMSGVAYQKVDILL